MDPRRPNMPPSGQDQGRQGQRQVQPQPSQSQPQPQPPQSHQPPRRYRYTAHGQSRISPLMPVYGDAQTQQVFPFDLPSRPAPGNGQPSSPPPSSGQQQQQTVTASPTGESPYPSDRTYLFILANELWCYCPEPRPHSFFVGHDPELVSDDEEVDLFYQASGIAAAKGMYVADERSVVAQSCPAPAYAPGRVDRDLWRCNRWVSGMCMYDGWTLFLGTSCYGCAASGQLYAPKQGYMSGYPGYRSGHDGQ
ncbi:hypothetical protein MAPG_08387 [Magnaporthiopsis poae ATCC 64411]|uniref:Uncharacterized protein n=1 Tax=Magnaporthiopsis poae (strain ATCC 64411 / 73-15) TaxID=644358 RepID=A0A0C4E784_MAGP6|nr:hypothetical protein MAPG_08387 [Magnaporthiopsis poae ATCC 64411]